VYVRHHLRGRCDGRDCGRVNEMKVAWMQVSRMRTYQCDRVASIVDGYDRIALGVGCLIPVASEPEARETLAALKRLVFRPIEATSVA
jgi:hypothetical protein